MMPVFSLGSDISGGLSFYFCLGFLNTDLVVPDNCTDLNVIKIPTMSMISQGAFRIFF